MPRGWGGGHLQFCITLQQGWKGSGDSKTCLLTVLGRECSHLSSLSHFWPPPLPHKLYESLSWGFTHIFIIYGQNLVTCQEFIIRGSACQREGGSTVSRCPRDPTALLEDSDLPPKHDFGFVGPAVCQSRRVCMFCLAAS